MPCTGTTRAGGACKANPLKGTDRCLAHSDAETRGSVGFVPDNGKGGRPKMPKPSDVARRLIEENVAVLLRPHFRALGLELNDDLTVERLHRGAIVVHQGEATTIEDLGAQIAAAEKLLDRVYGKARQQVDLAVEDDHAGTALITDPELREEARALLRRAAGLGPDEPSRPSSRDE